MAKTQRAAMTIQSALTGSPRVHARVTIAAVPRPATALQPTIRSVRFRGKEVEGSGLMGREQEKDGDGCARCKLGLRLRRGRAFAPSKPKKNPGLSARVRKPNC